MSRRLLAPVALCAALSIPTAGTAQQLQGPVFLWELSPGRSDDAAAQYVALLVDEAPGEGAWQLVAEDAFGVAQPRLGVLDGAALAPGFLLLATQETADAYGLEPDLLLDAASLATGGSGRLCLYEGVAEIDCVGYGSIADNGVWGVPGAPAVLPGQALTRVNTTGTNATDWVVADAPDPGQYLPAEQGDGGFTDGGEDAGDGGSQTGGSGGLPDGGVVITPGDGTGGGGIGGGQVPDREPRGCTAAGGSAGWALAVVLLAARRRWP